MIRNLIVALTALVMFCVEAATPGGTNTPYAVQTDALDGGGARATNAPYSNVGSVGLISGASAVDSYSTGHGYIAQISGFTAPTITTPANQTINENTNTGAISFTIGDNETAATSLTVTRASSNTTLVPLANAVLSGTTATRDITVTPASNQFGVTTISLDVTDAEGGKTSTSFTVTVNDVPVVAVNTGQACTAGGFTDIANTTLQVTDGDNTAAQLTYTITTAPTQGNLRKYTTAFGGGAFTALTASSTFTQADVDNSLIRYQNTGGSSDSVVFTVSDGRGGSIGSTTFNFTVGSNTPPTISDIANQSAFNEDGNSGAIAFTINDAQTQAAVLQLSGTSSNTTLVPNANITFGGSGGSRTVTVTPASNQFGTATITLTVQDSDGLQATDTFTITVNSVNDNPTISVVANQSINQDSSTGPIDFTIGDVETALGSLTVTATSSNTALIPNTSLALAGTGANRTITVTAPAAQTGTSTITITVSDTDSGQTQRQFTVTVTSPQTLVVQNINDSGADSLRDCMTRAQKGDTITFNTSVFATNLPNSATTIGILTELPAMNDGNVTIDASNVRASINGAAAGSSNGIVIVSSGNKIMGLTILSFTKSGILIKDGGKTNILGGSRTLGVGPNGRGLRIGGCGSFGIEITGVGTDSNLVKGSWIGLDVNGTGANANEFGLIVRGGAKLNVIGSETAGEENVVSGNNQEGITVADAGTEDNEIIGNFVGLTAESVSLISRNVSSRGEDDFSPTRSTANGGSGIVAAPGATKTKIGGTSGRKSNVVGFNKGSGVEVKDATSVGVESRGNKISKNGRGISLKNGANKGVKPPEITGVFPTRSTAASSGFNIRAGDSVGSVKGKAPGDGFIDLYTDFGEQGGKLTRSTAVANGEWSIDGLDIKLATGEKITATYTDLEGNTSEFAVAGASSGDTDGDSVPNESDLDSDNDGFSDAIELALGSNELDPEATPFNLPAIASAPLGVQGTKLSIKLGFSQAKPKDSIKISGTLPVEAGYAPLNSAVIIDVGGVVKSYSLDEKGARKDASGSFKVTLKLDRVTKTALANPAAKFSCTFNSAFYSDKFLEEGLTNTADIVKKSRTVPVTIIFGGKASRENIPIVYSAKTGKTGSGKN